MGPVITSSVVSTVHFGIESGRFLELRYTSAMAERTSPQTGGAVGLGWVRFGFRFRVSVISVSQAC